MAFKEAGIEIEWKGEGKNEKGVNLENGEVIVEIDANYYRPTEVDLLIGDSSKAKKELGWEHKYDLKSMVKEMVEADIKLFKRDQYLKDGGHQVLNYFEQ